MRRFVGNGTIVSVANNTSTQVTGQLLSMSAWVRPSSVSGAQQIFGDWGGAFSWVGGLTGGQPYFFMNGSVFYTFTGYTAVVGRLIHIAFVKDGATVRVFVNGVQVGSTSDSTSIAGIGQPLSIGAQNGGAESFSGDIGEVAFWAGALTNGEVVALSNGFRANAVRPSPELRGYWPLGVASPEPDYSNYGNIGTLSGNLDAIQLDLPASDMPVAWFGEVSSTGTDINAPFLNIGTGLFTPGISTPIIAPFLNIGVGLMPVNLVEDGAPPFVPPSLPPTIPPGTPTGPGVPLPPLSSGGLGGIRFYQGPPWRWLVTDLESNTITFLDRLATEAVVTYGLNQGSTAKLSMPSANPEVNILHTDGDPFVAEGNRLLYGFRREGPDGASDSIWKCRFAGKILLVEDTGLTENARTVITAWDPWHILYQRPMVNYVDTFADIAGFFSFNDTQVGVIALTFLRNTIVNQGEVGIDMSDDTPAWSTDGIPPVPSPVQLPGTQYWGSPYTAVWSGRTKSVYQTTNQVDTDCEQGLMVGEIWDQQVETGSVDILLTPIYDPVRRPGYQAEVSIYAKAGRQADDAIFAWDKPSRNVTKINRIIDGTKRANTIRYSWGQGGPPVSGGIPISNGASILKYGETWHMQYWPGRVEAAALALEELQLELMKDGQLTVAVQPTPERMPFLFTEWWLGDTVPEFASDRLRAELTGFQRIYGIVLNIDENAYEQIPQLLVSPNTATPP